MKLTCKNYGELEAALGDNSEMEFEGGYSVFKTTKGAFLLEKDDVQFLGLTKDNEVIVMPEIVKLNSPAVRAKANQFLPDSAKLTSKKSVVFLNGEQLKQYNMVTSEGNVMMED
jgi:hypothetical protein